MKKLIFEIECGEETCAFAKGHFCRFLIYDPAGRINCHLFGSLEEKNGWVQRHKDCIKKESDL